MAVDYTKLFTIIGSFTARVNEYLTDMNAYPTGQGVIESVLAAQDAIRFDDGLIEQIKEFQGDITGHIDAFISRVSDVLTDDELIGANFSFGQSPTLDLVFPALLKDMNDNDKNITANVTTVGAVTYVSENAAVGKLMVGTKLDGVTSPGEGYSAQLEYNGLSTQLIPTSETLTFTCISDSEGSATRGSEVFEITGTGEASAAYSPNGENVGNLGTITAIDNQGTTFLANASFDSWTAGEPDSWTNEGDAGTYTEGPNSVYGDGSCIKTVQADDTFRLSQTISNSLFTRRKSYFVSIWAAKDTDVASDESITIVFEDDIGAFNTLTFSPTTTNWVNYTFQINPPIEITGDVVVTISSGFGVLDATNDPVLIDNLVIVPCEYFAGAAFAITSGPDKFLLGDQIIVTISNNNAGVFQTFFRKAFGIQLPTDATPTISDSLVA